MLDTSLTISKVAARYRELINPVASLGFIGLATDRASLADFRAFVEPFQGVAIHATRIPFAPVATVETLKEMEVHLKTGAELLVPGQPLQTISFSCTSGTIAIGLDNVRRQIQSVRPDSTVVTPIGGAIKGLETLGARKYLGAHALPPQDGKDGRGLHGGQRLYAGCSFNLRSEWRS